MSVCKRLFGGSCMVCMSKRERKNMYVKLLCFGKISRIKGVTVFNCLFICEQLDSFFSVSIRFAFSLCVTRLDCYKQLKILYFGRVF